MLILGVKKVNAFIEKQNELGNDVRWDTYLKTLVFFRPHNAAVYSVDSNGRPNGVWRNGSYGFETKVEVNDKGLWEIDYRNVKRNSKIPRS